MPSPRSNLLDARRVLVCRRMAFKIHKKCWQEGWAGLGPMRISCYVWEGP